MKKLITLFIASFIFTYLLSQMSENKTALLLIDIQEFYFPGGFSELKNPEQASINANKVLNKFRGKNWLIVYIVHKVDNQGDINENVKPSQGEKIITKEQINSFRDTDLKKYLDENNISNLVICGMMTHMCVEAATRAAFDLGYKVTVISDACATKDLSLDGEIINALDVHNSTLATLKAYATVLKSDDYIKSVP